MMNKVRGSFVLSHINYQENASKPPPIFFLRVEPVNQNRVFAKMKIYSTSNLYLNQSNSSNNNNFDDLLLLLLLLLSTSSIIFMASEAQAFVLSILVFFTSLLSLPLITSASTSNIETFFPSLPSPAFIYTPPPPPVPPSTPPAPSRNDTNVTKAVIATAFSSFAFCFLLFFVFQFFASRKREVRVDPAAPGAKKGSSLQQLGSNSDIIVDENGLDAIYWRQSNQICKNCNRLLLDPSGRTQKEDHRNQQAIVSDGSDDDRRIQKKPLLPAGSVSSTSQIYQESFSSELSSSSIIAMVALGTAPDPNLVAPPNQQLSTVPSWAKSSTSRPPLPPRSSSLGSRSTEPLSIPVPTPPPPPPPSLPTVSNSYVAPSPHLPPTVANLNVAPQPPAAKAPPPPPPPTRPPSKGTPPPAAPPPPPRPPSKGRPAPAAPPPPPRPPVKGPPAPAAPPPPPAGSSRPGGPSAARPPPAPPGQRSEAAEGAQKKLKPLHWDKVNPNVDHSVVWNKMSDSFQ